MATASEVPPASSPEPADEAAAERTSKRYEALMTVRAKAMKGKGAWYWNHLEPILVVSGAGAAMAVKLRCSLCNSVFSASNPSRTASEHLKSGTCPNFSVTAVHPLPISSMPPSSSSTHHRKRLPAAAPEITLSGGKDDLGALAMLEDSVKKLKSSKSSSSPSAAAAISFLSDWFFESCGSVSLAAISHPKFLSFLRHVGLRPISPLELAGAARLDARFNELRRVADARLADARFFQLSSGGWKGGGDGVVTFAANLPNGTSVYRSVFFNLGGRVPPDYGEEILSGAAAGDRRCVGIVADGFKNTALRDIECRNQWMVNLPCQLHALRGLSKDFCREVPLFMSTAARCSKLATFFNSHPAARSVLRRRQKLDRSMLLRAPPPPYDVEAILAVVEDVMSNARQLQLAVLDEPFKLLCMEDTAAREVAETARDARFWKELEAVLSFFKLVEAMASDMEAERPLVGKCIPLWEELRLKVKEWCGKHGVDREHADKVFDERFKGNYREAWAAAFVLDPLNLVKEDASGKYLPPFKFLSPEQEKDVDRLVVRLVSREEAHVALMELMKWRTDGLDPLYAQAVQMKQLDPATGKIKLANPQSGRLVWETCLSEELKTLGKVAARLIFLHATTTSCGFNSGVLRWVGGGGRRRSPATAASVDRAQKMMFVAANARLERRVEISDEERRGDAEIFAAVEDELIDEEIFVVDSSSL